MVDGAAPAPSSMTGQTQAHPLDHLRGAVFLLAGLGLLIGTRLSAQGSQAFTRQARRAEGTWKINSPPSAETPSR